MAFLLLIVAFASLLASPSLSASSAPGEGGFEAVLKHVDRSKMSVERQKLRPNASFTNGFINSGHGEYYMNLTVGTPAKTYLAVIDTDTDFIWTSCTPMRCGARGNNCSKIQPYDPTKSSTYKKLSCTSAQCTQATTNTSCNKKGNGCIYNYQYPSGSPGSIQGDLAIETFGSSSFNGKASSAELIFGCTHATSIEDFENIRSGFVGLGRGKMSLVSQLNFTKFSHCFPSYDNPESVGVVAFGSYAKTKKVKGTVFAKILPNPINHLSPYYVDLKGIKVNGEPLAINTSAFEINSTAGVGGVIIDSGISLSYLEEGVFDKLKDKLNSLINLPKVNKTDDASLKVCYGTSKGKILEHVVPKIAFTFGNGNRQADLVLPTGNAFRSYEDSEHGHIMCLAMAAALPSDGKSSLGNMQLQDTLVVYDLVANKVSFTLDMC